MLGRDALLGLDLALDVTDGVGKVDVERGGLALRVLGEDLRGELAGVCRGRPCWHKSQHDTRAH
eukprot:15182325-Alexandrium_andersonii.AAC.1